MARSLLAVVLIGTCARAPAVPQGTAAAEPLPPPNVPLAFDTTCRQTSGAYCDWRIRCGLLDPADRPLCIDAMNCRQTRTQTAAAAREIDVDPVAAGQCLTSLATLTCETVFLSGPEDVSYPCRTMLVGKQDAGGPCHVRAACGADAYCLVGTACPPTCAPRARQGELCSPSRPCDGTLSCRHDGGGFPTCLPVPPNTCSVDQDCQPYQKCEAFGDAGFCVLNEVTVDAGASCDLSFHGPDAGPLRLCPPAFLCEDPSGLCVAIPSLGQSCGDLRVCLGDSVCVPDPNGGFVCALPGGAGALCSDASGCRDFYVCDLDGRCARGGRNGDPCAPDASTCLGYGTCEGATGTCLAGGGGSLCSLDSDCASGFCDTYGFEDFGGLECLPSCF